MAPARTLLALAVLVLRLANPGAAPDAGAAPPPVPYRVLQVNICNSGKAACYTGEATDRLVDLIAARRPSVVTVTEMCASDLRPVRDATGYRDGGAFTQAGTEICADGSAYGNAVLFAPGTEVGAVDAHVYLEQDSPVELRVLTCVAADGVTVCVTHLKSGSSARDREQRGLQAAEMRRLAGAYARRGPTVLAGDWNLTHGGLPNAHDFVPAGMYRKGDGGVQHVAVSDSFGLDRVHRLPLSWTDHPALQLDLTR